jgi:peroxiredoxin
VADDRFEDLGAGRKPPSAAERLAAGDEAEMAAERGERQRQGPPRPSSAYSWVIGIVFLIIVAVAGANALRTKGPGALGPDPGKHLAAFAAPTATGKLEGDANIKERKTQPGKTFACDVHGPDVVNLCELRRKPVVITFMFTRFAKCAPELDRIERIRSSYPQVNFVGVIVREPKDKAAALVRKHGWRFPVALDRDGQVSNIYGIGGCPTTVFAHRGGKVRATKLGNLNDAQLRAQIKPLL